MNASLDAQRSRLRLSDLRLSRLRQHTTDHRPSSTVHRPPIIVHRSPSLELANSQIRVTTKRFRRVLDDRSLSRFEHRSSFRNQKRLFSTNVEYRTIKYTSTDGRDEANRGRSIQSTLANFRRDIEKIAESKIRRPIFLHRTRIRAPIRRVPTTLLDHSSQSSIDEM